MMKKILEETDWEPFCCIMGVAVTLLSAALPIILAVSRQSGWWLLLRFVTGFVCGVYWSVAKSFCIGNYR